MDAKVDNPEWLRLQGIFNESFLKAAALYKEEADDVEFDVFGCKDLSSYIRYLQQSGFPQLILPQADIAASQSLANNPKFFKFFITQHFNPSLAMSQGRVDSKQKVGTFLEAPRKYMSYNPQNKHVNSLQNSAVKIDYASAIGGRDKQQDAIFIGNATDNFKKDDMGQVFKSVAREIEAIYQQDKMGKEIFHNGGSTAIIAHYGTDGKLTIANVGDSRAVLYIIKNNGTVEVKSKRLTNDHKADDLLENARVKNLGVKVDHKGRISGRSSGYSYNIGVSRSFGDMIFNQDNKTVISDESDIYEHPNIKAYFEENEQAFLCVS